MEGIFKNISVTDIRGCCNESGHCQWRQQRTYFHLHHGKPHRFRCLNVEVQSDAARSHWSSNIFWIKQHFFDEMRSCATFFLARRPRGEGTSRKFANGLNVGQEDPSVPCLPMGVGCSVQKLTAAPGAEHAQAIPRHYTIPDPRAAT
jgi:hypothetical protein